MSKKWNTVWIVGASSGIGKELALNLCEHADKIILSARSEDKLKELESNNSAFVSVPLDVIDTDAIQSTVQQIEQQHGAIDLVIYNAGVWHQMFAADFEADKFKHSMDVNYIGAVYTVGAVLPKMIERRKGHVALVASVAGFRGFPRGAAYGPTKAALNSLAESLKPDLDQYNIATTVINPGFVDTPMTAVNKFPMPFIMTAEKAAHIITKGLLKEKYEIAFPWPTVRALKRLRCLPNSASFWLTKRFGIG
ncbi:MAG: SDR family NAD(P)-dependent oxidoreductase [Pseudomonadota bacterium]